MQTEIYLSKLCLFPLMVFSSDAKEILTAEKSEKNEGKIQE